MARRPTPPADELTQEELHAWLQHQLTPPRHVRLPRQATGDHFLSSALRHLSAQGQVDRALLPPLLP